MTRALAPVLLLLALGCGGSVATINPVTPSPNPVAPASPSANMAGTWTGSAESSNFPAHAITLVVTQADSCVDGVWNDATFGWKGAISGLATADSFSGQISFERSSDAGGKCQAAGTVSGPVDGNTIRLTAGSLTAGGTCVGDLPQSLILSVQRQP